MHTSKLPTTPFILNSLEVHHKNGHITEIGLATLDTSLLPSKLSPADPRKRNEPSQNGISTWLQNASFFHFRIIDNARLIPPPRDPFQFGNTRWIHLREAKRFLEEAYSIDDGTGGVLPNIEISPSICLYRQALRESLEFDILDASTYVPIEMPCISPRGGTHGLKVAACTSGSHVGNTAAHNLIIRVVQMYQYGQMQMCTQTEGQFPSPLQSGLEADLNLRLIVSEVEKQGKAFCQPAIGFETFCMRCRRQGHEEVECKEKLYCGCRKIGQCGEKQCPSAMALGDGGLKVPRAVEGFRKTGEYGGRTS
ncbi:hypothetical protein K491DRAFT_683550 [Lophiostoma macrostomum CBS 122681]|uniref:Uncharacterized protein n=1 Tax=Lophiostoma macrostomum CBS 122681 TaxID=1314788 RepID=A0A6A6SRX6_9PLEO|nr:hypothetical protein K491DRAFT_683550 [Lophiostoma macrostomum CBS 122681]